MIGFKQHGNFNNTEKLLKQASQARYRAVLERYGQAGIDALASATPYDSGITASSWNYEIVQTKTSIKIVWTNSNLVNGVPLAILLQYGHGTKNGGYVQGIDFINPVAKPIFDQIAADLWREVTG